MNEIVHKVAAYITCDNKLLVFSHADYPDAGIQIPSGTVGDREDLDDAVLREAFEETGLDNVRIESFLGTRVYDMQPIDGRNVDIHRHYYHLSVPGPIEVNKWQHWELSPSEGTTEPILFELYWVEIPDGIPSLSGELGDMLNNLIIDA
jgi:8-oxo-dGTP pyrophosphatase MutT (NUDIX family)